MLIIIYNSSSEFTHRQIFKINGVKDVKKAIFNNIYAFIPEISNFSE